MFSCFFVCLVILDFMLNNVYNMLHRFQILFCSSKGQLFCLFVCLLVCLFQQAVNVAILKLYTLSSIQFSETKPLFSFCRLRQKRFCAVEGSAINLCKVYTQNLGIPFSGSLILEFSPLKKWDTQPIPFISFKGRHHPFPNSFWLLYSTFWYWFVCFLKYFPQGLQLVSVRKLVLWKILLHYLK